MAYHFDVPSLATFGLHLEFDKNLSRAIKKIETPKIEKNISLRSFCMRWFFHTKFQWIHLIRELPLGCYVE